MTGHTELIELLERVLPHADRRRDDFYDLLPWIGFQHRPAGATWPAEDKAAIVQILERQAELRIFHEHTQYFYGSAVIVTYEQLVDWLLMRASRVGAAQAVADVERYLSSNDIPYTVVAAIAGVEVSAGCELGGKVRIIPFSEVPDSLPKRIHDHRPLDHWPLRAEPKAALILTTSLPRRHEPHQVAILGGFGIPQTLYEAALLLTMSGPSAVGIMAAWPTPAEWVPCGHLCGNFAWSSALWGGEPGRSRLLNNEDLDSARTLHQAYLALPSVRRGALEIPLRRLNQALRRVDPVDAAVDLAVALETLFLPEYGPGRGEIGLSLRLRAARFLATGAADRQAVSKLVHGIYRIRSAGAHTGKAPEKAEGLATSELLQRGYDLTVRALEKAIKQGLPDDWNAVLLE